MTVNGGMVRKKLFSETHAHYVGCVIPVYVSLLSGNFPLIFRVSVLAQIVY